MMKGTITNFRARLPLFIKGAGGQGNVEFTIDTGYTGTLTLPVAICQALQIEEANTVPSWLADGNQIELTSYYLVAEWDGKERDVEILAVGTEPLLGAIMLDGHKLCLDFCNNTFTIEKSSRYTG